jgi:hypothetical protein
LWLNILTRLILNRVFFSEIIARHCLFLLLIPIRAFLSVIIRWILIILILVVIFISIIFHWLVIIITSFVVVVMTILLWTRVWCFIAFGLVFLVVLWTSWRILRDFLEGTFIVEMVIHIKIYVNCSYCRNTFKVNHALYSNDLYILFRCKFRFFNTLLLLILCQFFL